MIYKLIRDWFGNQIVTFNTGLSAELQLTEISTNLDVNFLPANLKDKSYIVKLNDAPNLENVVGRKFFDVKVSVEFQFLIAKQPITNYENVVDSYLYKLSAQILHGFQAYRNNAVSATLALITISQLRLSNLKVFDKNGNYLIPSLEFVLKTSDTAI